MAEGVAPAARVDDPARHPADNLGDEGAAATPRTLQRRGIVSLLWKGLFGAGDDTEKFLQHLSKEEAAVRSRMKRRMVSSEKTVRRVIAISVFLEVVAVAYAIKTTRELDLSWQLRAVRVLPMFLLPGLSAVIHSTLVSFTRMFDSKDKKTLERLRAERQAKIDELKERTNYYSTQQLIQKYDLDPAAKAAAATVLASKLGLDSGLKVYVGDEFETNAYSGKSYDVDLVQSTGLHNRKPSRASGCSPCSSSVSQSIDKTNNGYTADSPERHSPSQRHTDNYDGHSPGPNNGGWLARIAALLVGEDPTQCYALICSSCYMHNGLSRKEDFPYVTYYCPHCHALNGSSHLEEPELSSSSGNGTPMSVVDGDNNIRDESNKSPLIRRALGTSLPALQELPGEKEPLELA